MWENGSENCGPYSARDFLWFLSLSLSFFPTIPADSDALRATTKAARLRKIRSRQARPGGKTFKTFTFRSQTFSRPGKAPCPPSPLDLNIFPACDNLPLGNLSAVYRNFGCGRRAVFKASTPSTPEALRRFTV